MPAAAGRTLRVGADLAQVAILREQIAHRRPTIRAGRRRHRATWLTGPADRSPAGNDFFWLKSHPYSGIDRTLRRRKSSFFAKLRL